MRFGLHYQLACSAYQSLVQRYRDALEQAIYGEALGIMPAPLLLLAAVAESTKTMRLFSSRALPSELPPIIPRRLN